jgi:hypothetical protein
MMTGCVFFTGPLAGNVSTFLKLFGVGGYHPNPPPPPPPPQQFYTNLRVASNIVYIETHEMTKAVRKEDCAQVNFLHIINIAF